MKCPNCDNELMFEDQLDEYWMGRSYDVLWRVKCSNCDFEGKLWQSYELVNEDWDNS